MRYTDLKSRLSLLAPLIALIFILFPQILDKDKPVIAYTAGVAILMAVWWMTEIIPLAVTALIPVALFPLLGVMSGKAVAETYFNHLIFLFIGGFLIALAMERWNLHLRIALYLLKKIGVSPRRMLLGFMFVTAFLSMWISNTATAMMMVPILLSVTSKLSDIYKERKVLQMTKGYLLAIAYSASIGGIATLIGTPPNLSFARIFHIYFPHAPEIVFFDWMKFAFPLALLLLAVSYFYLRFLFFHQVKEVSSKEAQAIIVHEYRELGPMKYEEKWIAGLFVLLILLWFFRRPIHLDFVTVPGWSQLFKHASYIKDGNVAILVSILLFLIPSKHRKHGKFLMDWKTAERLPWGIILLFGGGFALASGFKESGLSAYIGGLFKDMHSVPPLMVILLVVTAITFLTELTSNTATVETFLPILASVSVALGIHPLLMMIPATIAGSFAFMLPVATPPNAIVFGSGKLKVEDMARTGFWLNIAGIILLTLVSYFFLGRIYGFDMFHLPGWIH